MPHVSATITIPADVSVVYEYLATRYQGDPYRDACSQAKNYIPQIETVTENPNSLLRFRVAARDALLKFQLSGWEWQYELSTVADGATSIRITYEWSIFLSIIRAFTAGHQAANELTATVLALQALSFERNSHE